MPQAENSCAVMRDPARCGEAPLGRNRGPTAKKRGGAERVFGHLYFPVGTSQGCHRSEGAREPGIHTGLSSDMRGIEVFAVSWTLGSPSSKDSEQ